MEECGEGLLDRPSVRAPFIAAYLAVFAVCLVGNLFTIVVICAHRSMRTATNFFLANLAVADLLVAIFCILQNMLHLVGSEKGHWPLGATLCNLYAFVLHLVPCTGIGILVCVSVEKYIAVLHPLLALKVLTPRFRTLLMASIWVVSVLSNLPYYTASLHITYKKINFAACTREYQLTSWLSTRNMVTLSFLVWYCVPLATIAYLYTRIGLVLWHSAPLKKLTQADALRTVSNETNTAATVVDKRSVVSNHPRDVLNAINGIAAADEARCGGTAAAPLPSNGHPLPLIRVTSRPAARLSSGSMHEAAAGTPMAHKERGEEEELDEGYADEDVVPEEQKRANGRANGAAVRNGNGTAGATATVVRHSVMTTSGTVIVSTMESRKKIIRLLIAIVCSFAILTLPHHARMVYNVWTDRALCNSGLESLVQPIAYLLLFISSSCNPFLYAFMSQRFRSAIRDLFKCRRGRMGRKSTRTRTQNSDVVGCTTGMGGGAAAGGTTTTAAPVPADQLSRYSSLTRLNYSTSANTALLQGTPPHQTGALSTTGSERNLLLAQHNKCGSNHHLKVQHKGSERTRSTRSGSGGSGNSTASSVVCTRFNGSLHMAVVYRKSGKP